MRQSMPRELKDLSKRRLSSCRSQKASHNIFKTIFCDRSPRQIITDAAREVHQESGISPASDVCEALPAVSLGIISIIDMLMVFLCQNIFSKVFSCQNILQREPRLIMSLIISKVSTHLFKYNRKSGDSEVSILM